MKRTCTKAEDEDEPQGCEDDLRKKKKEDDPRRKKALPGRYGQSLYKSCRSGVSKEHLNGQS